MASTMKKALAGAALAALTAAGVQAEDKADDAMKQAAMKAAEKNMFAVEFAGCSKDGVALDGKAIISTVGYRPLEVVLIEAGDRIYAQAGKEEVAAVAGPSLTRNFRDLIAANDVAALTPRFLFENADAPGYVLKSGGVLRFEGDMAAGRATLRAQDGAAVGMIQMGQMTAEEVTALENRLRPLVSLPGRKPFAVGFEKVATMLEQLAAEGVFPARAADRAIALLEKDESIQVYGVFSAKTADEVVNILKAKGSIALADEKDRAKLYKEVVSKRYRAKYDALTTPEGQIGFIEDNGSFVPSSIFNMVIAETRTQLRGTLDKDSLVSFKGEGVTVTPNGKSCTPAP